MSLQLMLLLLLWLVGWLVGWLSVGYQLVGLFVWLVVCLLVGSFPLFVCLLDCLFVVLMSSSTPLSLSSSWSLCFLVVVAVAV